jgi:hypothetical protein
MWQFVTENWAVLVPAFILFWDVVANLTPSDKDNKITSFLSQAVNYLVKDRRK